MPEGKEPRDRSVSGDFDDSDFESHAGDSNPPGKPGRKKNPNSQAARRDQNRIAQREFRLRKQQRIRDLEARVEILSGGKDEALGEMRNILKDLMTENQNLRNLLRSLATFIGDGAGGLLPKLGWDLNDFNNYINKSETDTAWEGYQKRKRSHNSDSGSSGLPPPQSQKRQSEDDSAGLRSKKARNGDEKDLDRNPSNFGLLALQPTPIPSSSMYPVSSRQQERNGMFHELMRSSNGTSMFMQPSPTSNASPQYSGAPTADLDNYQSSYLPAVNLNLGQPLSTLSYDSQNVVPVSQQRMQPQPADPEELLEGDDDPNKNEAFKLIHYHLENYNRNSAYCLPSSLRPTVVQRSMAHEGMIDHIPHPELRDRMIIFRARYDLSECLHDYRRGVTIHGDDVLAHNNWEIGEPFLRKYSFLIDNVILNISNRWRKERGESELRSADYVTEPNATS